MSRNCICRTIAVCNICYRKSGFFVNCCAFTNITNDRTRSVFLIRFNNTRVDTVFYCQISISSVTTIDTTNVSFNFTSSIIVNKGRIQITKHISGPRPTEGPITFEFDVYITYDNRETKQKVQITLNGNNPETWVSEYYYWGEDENAPRYRVVETNNGGYQDTTIENDNGYLENKEEPISVKVFNTRENVVEYEKGELQITKKLTDGTNNFVGKTFEFDVWVEGYGTETVKIEAGNSWAKEYTWIKGEKIPEYKVTEKKADGYNIFSGASGSLTANNTVVVEAINTFKYENRGSKKVIRN